MSRLKQLYDKLDQGSTPAAVLLPWFPSYGMLKKLSATKEIYDIVSKAIEARERGGLSQEDTLQMLFDAGDDRLVIVGVKSFSRFMGPPLNIFLVYYGSAHCRRASHRNFGSVWFTLHIVSPRLTCSVSAAWLVTFLGASSEWKMKARAEVEGLLHTYSSVNVTPTSISAELSTIPLEAWEAQTPVLDAIIRETLRLGQPHAAMRRNLGKEVYIEGRAIPTGTYVIYPFSDVHLNPELCAHLSPTCPVCSYD